jgi:hypothetical protein
VKIAFAPFRKCVQKLAPGELKRTPQRGALVGYYVACPECRFPNIILDDRAGAPPRFIEEPPTPRGDVVQPALLTMRDAERCSSCRRLIQIAAGEVTAA